MENYGLRWKPISPTYGEYMKGRKKNKRRKRLKALGVRGMQKDVLSHYIELFQRRSKELEKTMRNYPKEQKLKIADRLKELAEEMLKKMKVMDEKQKKKEQEKLTAIAGIRRMILRKK